MTDYISRADAIAKAKKKEEAFALKGNIKMSRRYGWLAEKIKALPSADADGEDLIIKGAKGIQDGLYNIKDGKLFKYKGKGGTVRTYPIVPSADAVDCTDFVNWLTDAVMDEEDWELNAVAYGEIICRKLVKLGVLEVTEEPSYYIRPSADAVSEDTQTEEQARFVAKETELAHIEARLENAEKRLQGVCVANFVAEQLERLREMTDEERWEFFKRFFEVEGGAE